MLTFKCILLSLAALLLQEVNSFDPLKVWSFGEPTLEKSTGIQLTLSYPVSDFIIPQMVQWSLWDTECEQGGTTVDEYMSGELTAPLPEHTQGDGSGDAFVNVTVNIDSQSLNTSTPSSIFEYYQQGAQRMAKLQFCVRAALLTLEAQPMMVDYWDTLVVMDYDLTDGFQLIELLLTPERAEKEADQEYGPEGYWCDEDGIRLEDEDILGLGMPGKELSVCVVPDEQARSAGFGLDKINSFAWVRVDESTGQRVEQPAVNDGETSGDGLTTMVCDDDGCGFRSILKANFFQAELPTPSPTQAPTPSPTPAPTVAQPINLLVPGLVTGDQPGWENAIDGDINSSWWSPSPEPQVMFDFTTPEYQSLEYFSFTVADPSSDTVPTEIWLWACPTTSSCGGGELIYQGGVPSFSFPGQRKFFPFDPPITGILTRFVIRVVDTQGASTILGSKISEMELYASPSPSRRSLATTADIANLPSPAIFLSEEEEAAIVEEKALIQSLQDSAVDEFVQHQLALKHQHGTGKSSSRGLQEEEEKKSIGGIGVATVKFRRRRYRRNLQTGDEGWESFVDKRRRKLQVGGRGSISLGLDIVQFNDDQSSRLRSRSSSPQLSYLACFTSVLFTGFASLVAMP